MTSKFSFEISLSVLNHLGRNLYRNIITVIGEAISNSWDADAKNVWIEIDREKNSMVIKDDGVGMDEDDFQEKFLRIGYSKRKKGSYTSPMGRPYIGRKGIGKLALLSCAGRISVLSKKEKCGVIGGMIDNSALDEAITEDESTYVLEQIDDGLFSGLSHGTIISFENVTNGFFNTIEYLQKALALSFRFSIIDDSFNIFLNGALINDEMLNDLAEATQFCWRINDFSDYYIDKKIKCDKIELKNDSQIQGYIASVKKPSSLKMRGTKEKVTLDLFVNGRLREKDLLRHINTSRIVENYVYGQIHCNALDEGDTTDIFTSSREGLKSDDPLVQIIMQDVEVAFRKVIDEWDHLRREKEDDGDPDNFVVTKKARKAEELFNATIKDMDEHEVLLEKNGIVEDWVKMLANEAQFNVPSYTECFIAENLLREYIEYMKLDLSQEAKNSANEFRNRESRNKGLANISFQIRNRTGDIFYLDMDNLANFIDKPQDKYREPGISRSAVVYKPLRDAVGHTSLLTENAKNRLSSEFENIKARLIEVLELFSKENS